MNCDNYNNNDKNEVISLESVSKSIGSIQVIKAITLSFAAGTITLIKGVSGSGKSTLLSMIGGLATPTSGQVRFKPDPESKATSNSGAGDGIAAAIRANSGYMFPESMLMSRLTVRQNLAYIHNDNDRIEELAAFVSMEDNLDRCPENLSSGQRQRACLMRALLRDPVLIVADEPTASLDQENSMKTAALFEMMRNEKRVIVIATHEDCFDGIADRIVHLEYGEISTIENGMRQASQSGFSLSEGIRQPKSSIAGSLSCILARQRNRFSKGRIASLVLLFFFLMVCIGVQENFLREYSLLVQDNYPIEVLALYSDHVDRISSQTDLRIYRDYAFEEGEISCYTLLDPKDSGFYYGKGTFIQFGTFPYDDNQVLVSGRFVANCMGGIDPRKAVGKDISIRGQDLTVVGVLSEEAYSKYNPLIYPNIYYQVGFSDNAVFIPYNKIRELSGGIEVFHFYTMVSCPGLFESPEIFELVFSNEQTFSYWEMQVDEIQTAIDAVLLVIAAFLAIACVLVAVFLSSSIRVDLFYRKRELGSLQIFGISKSKIKGQIFVEHSLGLVMAFVGSLAAYGLLSLILLLFSVRLAIMPWKLIAMFGVLVGFNSISIAFPLKRFLRMDAYELVRMQ